MADLFERAKGELNFVNQWIEHCLSRKSAWSGELRLFREPKQVAGYKDFSCYIALNEDLQGQLSRWATHLHEVLHGFSEGYSLTAYNSAPGWEEGVVEKLQRLLRPFLLENIGNGRAIALAIEQKKLDVEHPYNTYIQVLEALRYLVQEESEMRFYVQLLQVPLSEREQFLLAQIQQLYRQNRVAGRMYHSLSAVLNDSTIIGLLGGNSSE